MIAYLSTLFFVVVLFCPIHVQDVLRNDTYLLKDVDNNLDIEENGTDVKFPIPEKTLTEMVEAAKDFVHTYLSIEEFQRMKKLVHTVREIGGNRRDTHRAITLFLSRVLTSEKKRKITDKKEKLFTVFGDNLKNFS